MWKIFVMKEIIIQFYLIQQSSTEYHLVLIHTALERRNRYESYRSYRWQNTKEQGMKEEYGTRELFGSERAIWEKKWGQKTAQCVSGISNNLALQYENQLVNKNKHVQAYSMWRTALKVYLFVHLINIDWLPVIRQELY